jgi:hypothetical protein
MINGFDIGAEFAFDTVGQADGMHINGPPIKAIVTKFFHYLCRGVLSSDSLQKTTCLIATINKTLQDQRGSE